MRALITDADLPVAPAADGASLWEDNLVIPTGAKNIDNSYAPLDFLLRSEVAKMVSKGLGYATPNQAALALPPKEFRDIWVVCPIQVSLKNSEFQVEVGEAMISYERYWEGLQVGRD